MQKKRLIVCMLILTLSLQFLSLPLAFAEDSTKPVENEDGTLTLTHEYPAEDEAPVLPEAITQGGQRYVLDEADTTPAENYEPPKQTFTRTFSSEVPLGGINNLGAYFPATYAIDEGEYQGEIGLDPVNPYTITERYEAFRQQVDRATVLYGLPDNDVTRIPTSQVFEVQSAAAPGATTQATLQLLDVRYEVAGTDHLGLPNNYTAYLTYRGQEEYLELHHYDVTANYSGELTSNKEQLATTGLYKPVEAAAPPPTTITEPETPLAAPEPSFVPLAVTSAVIVVVLALPVFLYFLLKNARLLRVTSSSSERDDTAMHNNEDRTESGSKRKEQVQLVCRRKLALHEGVAVFRIPARIDIFDGALYCLSIKPHIARQEGSVEMVWQGKVVAAMPLAEHIDINFRELLISSVETAIIETDLID